MDRLALLVEVSAITTRISLSDTSLERQRSTCMQHRILLPQRRLHLPCVQRPFITSSTTTRERGAGTLARQCDVHWRHVWYLPRIGARTCFTGGRYRKIKWTIRKKVQSMTAAFGRIMIEKMNGLNLQHDHLAGRLWFGWEVSRKLKSNKMKNYF